MEILWLHEQLSKANAEIMTLKDRLELAEIKRDHYQKESQEAYKKLGEAEYGPLMQRIRELDDLHENNCLIQRDQLKSIAQLEEENKKLKSGVDGYWQGDQFEH